MKEIRKIDHTVGTIPKPNRQIIERGQIDNPNTSMTTHFRHVNKKWRSSASCIGLSFPS